jgi:hypothetical protein
VKMGKIRNVRRSGNSSHDNMGIDIIGHSGGIDIVGIL